MKYIGKKFEKLTVISLDRKDNNNKKYYLCKCDCGNEKIIRSDSFVTGKTKSCGCLSKEFNKSQKGQKVKDITGQIYGRLTALYRLDKTNKYYNSFWICKCECGNEVEVRLSQLTAGKTKSCGCLNRELSSKRMKGSNHPMYGVRGENHHKWNPSLTDKERHDKRDTVENYHFRNSVFERDNYTCIVCGNKGLLNAHHITNYYLDIDNRYNIDNGITMCEKCHKAFHKKYGNKNNNKMQLEEFIKDNTEVN